MKNFYISVFMLALISNFSFSCSSNVKNKVVEEVPPDFKNKVVDYPVNAEDKDPYAKKGAAWKTWVKFSKTVIAQDKDEVKQMISVNLAEEFSLYMLKRISEEFRQNQGTFVREFYGKNKKFKYLVITMKNKNISIVLKKGVKAFTIDDTIEQNLQGPEDEINPENRLRAKAKLAKVKSHLKQIGQTYAMYFADATTATIPTPQVVDVDSSIMTYDHPQTDKEEKSLFIQPGYNFRGDPGLILAITDKPIFGNHQAVFECGRVESITVDEFKKHSTVLGVTREKTIYKELNGDLKKEILNLIEQLGATEYKERKAVKNTLLFKGQEIVGFLEKNKNHSDLKVKVIIEEIINKLKSKGPGAKRPNIR